MLLMTVVGRASVKTGLRAIGKHSLYWLPCKCVATRNRFVMAAYVSRQWLWIEDETRTLKGKRQIQDRAERRTKAMDDGSGDSLRRSRTESRFKPPAAHSRNLGTCRGYVFPSAIDIPVHR